MHERNDKIMIYTCTYVSPLGDILLAADEIGLVGLWFEGQKCTTVPVKAAYGTRKEAGKAAIDPWKEKNHPYRRRGYPAETEIGWEDIKYSKCTYKFYYALFFIFFNCYNDLIKT